MIIDRVGFKGSPFHFAGAVEQIELELAQEARDQNKFNDRIGFGLQSEPKQITQNALSVVAFLSQQNLGGFAYVRASLRADKESSEIVVDAKDDSVAPAWEVVKNKLSERGWIDQVSVILAAFDRPKDRRIVELLFKNKTDKEIASDELVDMKPGSVRTRIYSLRGMLKTKFGHDVLPKR